jgi:hypothetical protein
MGSANIDDSIVFSELTDTAGSPVREERGHGDGSDLWLRNGFFAAILLAIFGFATVAAYLSYYAYETNASFSQESISTLRTLSDVQIKDILFVHLAVWQFALQACGMMAGVVIGFLGLALFLLGIKGDMSGGGKAWGHTLNFNHMAPGTLVISMGCLLIGICATHRSTLEVRPASIPLGSNSAPYRSGVEGGSSKSAGPPAVTYDKNQAQGAPASVCVPDPSIGKTCPAK